MFFQERNQCKRVPIFLKSEQECHNIGKNDSTCISFMKSNSSKQTRIGDYELEQKIIFYQIGAQVYESVKKMNQKCIDSHQIRANCNRLSQSEPVCIVVQEIEPYVAYIDFQ